MWPRTCADRCESPCGSRSSVGRRSLARDACGPAFPHRGQSNVEKHVEVVLRIRGEDVLPYPFERAGGNRHRWFLFVDQANHVADIALLRIEQLGTARGPATGVNKAGMQRPDLG